MANQRVVSLRNKLESAFLRAKKIDRQEYELQSDFAKHLCVLVSGFIEYVIYELALAYCRSRSSPEVLSFVATRLDKIQNPNSHKIRDLLASFDPIWGDEFEKVTEGEMKDALNSILSLRNQIAHGEVANTTLAAILKYYEQVKLIIVFLESKFDP